MAGNFTSPSGAPPKMKHGKPNRPKMTYEVQYPFASAPEYPITDSFASESIPSFAERHRATNNKSGWNCKPSKSTRGGLSTFRKVSSPERGRGRTI